jgi:glycerol-3-phosphate O-acyltransferase
LTEPVVVPLWLALIFAGLAVWLLISRLLLPTVRWYFRRQANQLIEGVNRSLNLRIPPLSLTRRQVLIDRLVYDPTIARMVAAHCEATGEPRKVAMDRVERYAREIVPAFNAYVYFRFGGWLARKLVRALYRVRLGFIDEQALAEVGEDASLVFVINHRSNMDYVLVAHLAMTRTVLSYAVGEWARVWPLQQLIRSVGAYFVRRGSGNPLYRRVLERYVQMAVEGGVTQVVFPEGGLSRDGRLGEPRVGLIDYMLRNFDPKGTRDIVFLPIAISYDRVLEDRTLIAELDPDVPRRSGWAAMRKTVGFLLHNLRLGLRKRWYRFGYACANFGRPISLKAYLAECDWDPRDLAAPERSARLLRLATRLMDEVGHLVPVLPVSLIASLFQDHPERSLDAEEIRTLAHQLQSELMSRDAQVYLPRQSDDYAVDVGLRMLRLRRIVLEENGRFRANPAETQILAYYANAIAHLREDGGDARQALAKQPAAGAL